VKPAKTSHCLIEADVKQEPFACGVSARLFERESRQTPSVVHQRVACDSAEVGLRSSNRTVRRGISQRSRVRHRGGRRERCASLFGDDAIGPLDEVDEYRWIAELESPLRHDGFGDAARTTARAASEYGNLGRDDFLERFFQ
jgi:hypothetical protein